MPGFLQLRSVLSFLLLCSWETLWAAPIRVVSQAVGTDELLVALAEPAQIAALSHISRAAEFSAVAKEASAYPSIAQGDAETILKYQPTLVLAADYSRVELVEQVRRAGVKVIVFDRYHTIEDAFANLRQLAAELGGEAPARAEAIVQDCIGRIRVLEERLKNVKPSRVIAPSTYGVIAGAGTTFDDICVHAGAVNLASSLGGLRGHQVPPNEKILTWPIDSIVIDGAEDAAALAPYLTLLPYKFLSAVKERRMVRLEPYMLSTVSHYRVAAYEMLALGLHPEVFR
ncbi:MAG: ABC transporter substrate-binding protein [Verrucomicrobiota bacterium]